MGGCTLLLARNSPVRTTLVDEATGHTKYKIETPIRITRSVTRIKKYDSPPQPPANRDKEADSDSGDDITDKKNKKKKSKSKRDEKRKREAELAGTGDEIAGIYWKCLSPDKFVFRGKATTQSEFLPQAGKLRGSYVFTGPDGVQYRWAMGASGMCYPRLVTTDGRKTVIAEFHRARYFWNRRKARLEVQPTGMNMLDDIVLTFVYAEYQRRKREARARSNGGCVR